MAFHTCRPTCVYLQFNLCCARPNGHTVEYMTTILCDDCYILCYTRTSWATIVTSRMIVVIFCAKSAWVLVYPLRPMVLPVWVLLVYPVCPMLLSFWVLLYLVWQIILSVSFMFYHLWWLLLPVEILLHFFFIDCYFLVECCYILIASCWSHLVYYYILSDECYYLFEFWARLMYWLIANKCFENPKERFQIHHMSIL